MHTSKPSIYKNYDIRGKYPDEITEAEVTRIGAALVHRFGIRKIAVGRDNRPSAESLFHAFVVGLEALGAEVIDLGYVTTPMTYWYCGSTDVDATAMITASHMPAEYNGLKICVEDAKPLTTDMLQELREIVGSHTFSTSFTTKDLHHAKKDDLLPRWRKRFEEEHDFTGSGLTVVIDPANMIGVKEIETFKAYEPHLTVHTICDELDHTCPHHEANPIKHETLEMLGDTVRKNNAHMGVAFDGDADRVGIVDEAGTPVPSDLVGLLVALELLKKHPHSHVLYDIRSSKIVPEMIEQHGGIPLEWKVGHANIRTKMRELDALMGIELSGHFFFRDSYFSEGGPKPALHLLELIHSSGEPLSTHVSKLRKYHHSGEINSTIERTADDIYTKLKNTYQDATINELDGVKIIYDDWWCNVRPSATDPVMRLNLEANTKEVMEKRLEEVLAIIRR